MGKIINALKSYFRLVRKPMDEETRFLAMIDSPKPSKPPETEIAPDQHPTAHRPN